MILSLFRRNANTPDPYPLYESIVDQARQPFFYGELDVDDSLNGRFDMIVLHAVLVFHTLAQRNQAAFDLSQAAFDLMFRDMDRSLRERGVGDTSVPGKIRKMGEVFYGRAEAYRPALSIGDQAALTDAIYRNVYAGEGAKDRAGTLSNYTMQAADALQNTSGEAFAKGRLPWPDAVTLPPAG